MTTSKEKAPEKSGLKMYNPHEGLTGRDGGPYLDQVENDLAEDRRAFVEGREPDYEAAKKNPSAGTPLVTGSQLLQMANPASNPSQQGNDVLAQAVDVLSVDDNFKVESVAEIPAGSITGVDTPVYENPGAEDPTNPTNDASYPAQAPGLLNRAEDQGVVEK